MVARADQYHKTNATRTGMGCCVLVQGGDIVPLIISCVMLCGARFFSI